MNAPAMNGFIVVITRHQRTAVFAVWAEDAADAERMVLARNAGWTVERVSKKKGKGLFRIYDSDWYEYEETT